MRDVQVTVLKMKLKLHKTTNDVRMKSKNYLFTWPTVFTSRIGYNFIVEIVRINDKFFSFTTLEV